jgi:hypothetical protein
VDGEVATVVEVVVMVEEGMEVVVVVLVAVVVLVVQEGLVVAVPAVVAVAERVPVRGIQTEAQPVQVVAPVVRAVAVLAVRAVVAQETEGVVQARAAEAAALLAGLDHGFLTFVLVWTHLSEDGKQHCRSTAEGIRALSETCLLSTLPLLLLLMCLPNSPRMEM